MSSPFRILLPIWPLLACASLSGAVSLDDLVKSSPFMPGDQAGAAVTVPTENAAVEFRGMISTKDGVLFGLYDRTKQTGAWVRKEDAGADFVVHSYDAANDMVSVDYHGQKFNLALSSAKIGMAMASALAAPGVVGPPSPDGAPGVARVDDTRRLESIAAEVRRRRALRQGAVAAQPAGAAATAPASDAGNARPRNRQ